MDTVKYLTDAPLDQCNAKNNMYFIHYTTQLDGIVENLKEKLDSKQKEAAAWKAKYNIKTQEEAEAASRQ